MWAFLRQLDQLQRSNNIYSSRNSGHPYPGRTERTNHAERYTRYRRRSHWSDQNNSITRRTDRDCLPARDKIMASGGLSAFIGILSMIYAIYEMRLTGNFYGHSPAVPVVNENSSRTTLYYNKYEEEVTQEQFERLQGYEKWDKGLCAMHTITAMLSIVISIQLIKSVKMEDQRSYLPWVSVTLLHFVCGTIYVSFNTITIDFEASINFVLLLWIIGTLLQFNCMRNVFMAYRMSNSSRETSRNQEGVAVFDPHAPHVNDVYIVSGQNLNQVPSPVRIMLKPPSYEEAIAAPTEDPTVPNPFGKSHLTLQTDDKPPEYSV